MGCVDETTRINRNNRTRGKAFERRVVAAFREGGFNCRRTPFSGAAISYGKGDIEFLDGSDIFCECKNYKVDLIAMLDTSKYANLMEKAYQQACSKLTTIAIRTTKGNNVLVVEKNVYIERYIRMWRIDPYILLYYGEVEFYVLPLETGIKALANTYLHPNQQAEIG